MSGSVAIWVSEDDRLALHPWEPLGCSSKANLTAELRDDTVVTGLGWWSIVLYKGDTFASEIPAEICVSCREGLDRPRLADDCQLRHDRMHRQAIAGRITPQEVAILMGTHGGNEVLSQHYWGDSVVRERVVRAIEVSQDHSMDLHNACMVANRVQDPDLWESLCARAKRGNALAEVCLRDWPDARGIPFFEKGLVSGRRPYFVNSLFFFLCCCLDEGIGFVSTRLGDPFLDAPASGGVREGRFKVLKALDDFHQLTGREVSEAWREYGAAALLVTPVDEENAWIAERGLEVMRRYEDPREAILVKKLAVEGILP